jgi:hypothetical protein
VRTSTQSPTPGVAGCSAFLGAALYAQSHQDAPRVPDAPAGPTLRGRPIVSPFGELALLAGRRDELEEEILALWEG